VAGTGAAAALPEPRGARRGCLGRSMAASASAMADVVVVECWWRRRSSPPSAWIGLAVGALSGRCGLDPRESGWVVAGSGASVLDLVALCVSASPLQRHLRHRGGCGSNGS